MALDPHVHAGTAGMMPVSLALHEGASHWGVYFTVADAVEAVRHTKALGGSECVALREILGVGASGLQALVTPAVPAWRRSSQDADVGHAASELKSLRA